jgi:hypothetical protein
MLSARYQGKTTIEEGGRSISVTTREVELKKHSELDRCGLPITSIAKG